MFEEDNKNKRSQKIQNARDLELLAIQNIMKIEIGREFMFRCLQNCCTFDNTYNEEASRHSFNAGLRSHGIWLDGELLEAAPDDYYRMLKENR